MKLLPINMDAIDLQQVQELAKELVGITEAYVQMKEKHGGKVKLETLIIAYKIAQQPVLDEMVKDQNGLEGMALPSYGAVGQA
jgi:hypothetical protein